MTKKRRGKKTRVRSHVSEFLPVSVCPFQPSVRALEHGIQLEEMPLYGCGRPLSFWWESVQDVSSVLLKDAVCGNEL